eukprot:scaffold99058_cov69-Phaeocystis_antarctica.AAC.1
MPLLQWSTSASAGRPCRSSAQWSLRCAGRGRAPWATDPRRFDGAHLSSTLKLRQRGGKRVSRRGLQTAPRAWRRPMRCGSARAAESDLNQSTRAGVTGRSDRTARSSSSAERRQHSQSRPSNPLVQPPQRVQTGRRSSERTSGWERRCI